MLNLLPLNIREEALPFDKYLQQNQVEYKQPSVMNSKNRQTERSRRRLERRQRICKLIHMDALLLTCYLLTLTWESNITIWFKKWRNRAYKNSLLNIFIAWNLSVILAWLNYFFRFKKYHPWRWHHGKYYFISIYDQDSVLIIFDNSVGQVFSWTIFKNKFPKSW